MSRPIIGSNYRPSRFERRDRNGTYEALHPKFSADATELQQSFLDSRYGFDQTDEELGVTPFVGDTVTNLVIAAAFCAAIAAFVLLVLP